MSDLAFAAAAAGEKVAVDMLAETSGDMPAEESPRDRDSTPYELPSVDDLEVAALAAASAMQAMQELQQLSSEEEDSSSEGETSSDDDDSADSDSSEEPDAAPTKGLVGVNAAPVCNAASHMEGVQQQQQAEQPVSLQFHTAADGSISITVQVQQQQQQHVPRRAVAESSSSSDEESDIESIDYNEMREFIDKAYARDEDDEASNAPNLQEDLGWSSNVSSVTDITVPEGAELKQAGSIMSLLEGMVVVQGLANSRALDIGSVLLLEDKMPIGRIEEVFGRITEPVYALRYAGPQPPPATLAANSRVFFTDSLAALVEDQVYTEGAGKASKASRSAAADYEPGFEEEDEPYFSDDEAEAEWRRSQGMTKRKAGGEAGVPDGGSRGGRHGRGRFGSGRGGRGGRGGRSDNTPSAGFRAHATAAQVQRMGLQQQDGAGGRGHRGGRGGRGRDRQAPGQQQQQQQQWGQQQQPMPPPGFCPPQQPQGPPYGIMLQNGHTQAAAPNMQQGMMMPPTMQQAAGAPWYGQQQQGSMMMMPPPLQMQGQYMGQPWGQQQQQQPPLGYSQQPQQQYRQSQQQQQQQQQQWTGYGAFPPPSRG